MKFELLYSNQLTRAEINALKRLTFGSRGELMYTLDAFGERPNSRVIRLTDDDGKILSWGFMHRYHPSDRTKRWDFQLYTRKSERCKGYGSMIYKKAVQVAHGRDRMLVHPHSPESDAYFSKNHFDESGAVRKSKKKRK